MIDTCAEELMTLEANLVSVKLRNKSLMDVYLDPLEFKAEGELQARIPLTIIINDSDQLIQDKHYGGFDFKGINELKDKETGMTICA